MRLRSKVLLVCGILGMLAMASVAQAGLSDYVPPVDISKEGHRIDSLFYLVTIMLLVLFAILCFVLVVAGVAHREGSKHHVHYHLGYDKRDLLIAAAISSIIFVVVDGTLLVHSYDDLTNAFWNYPEDSPELTRVQIMPQQWAWRFRIPGADGEFNTADDIVTLNDLRVPVDKPVLVQMMSRDVIHSFFLPNVRQKQDANPGSVTKMTFTPQQTGTFEVVCAEMCGIAHYKMRAEMTVMSQEDYETWHKEATIWAEAGYDEEDADGQWGWDWEGNS